MLPFETWIWWVRERVLVSFLWLQGPSQRPYILFLFLLKTNQTLQTELAHKSCFNWLLKRSKARDAVGVQDGVCVCCQPGREKVPAKLMTHVCRWEVLKTCGGGRHSHAEVGWRWLHFDFFSWFCQDVWTHCRSLTQTENKKRKEKRPLSPLPSET